MDITESQLNGLVELLADKLEQRYASRQAQQVQDPQVAAVVEPPPTKKQLRLVDTNPVLENIYEKLQEASILAEEMDARYAAIVLQGPGGIIVHQSDGVDRWRLVGLLEAAKVNQLFSRQKA